MNAIVFNVTLLAGWAMLFVGALLVWVPLGLMVGGGLLIWIVLFLARWVGVQSPPSDRNTD
jgi:hypothetical protein